MNISMRHYVTVAVGAEQMEIAAIWLYVTV